jgi:hypothetical protein
MHVTLIYAEVQNSKDLSTWDAATVTTIGSQEGYATMDKPKKSLRFAYQALLDDASFTYTVDTTTNISADKIDITESGELIKKGLCAGDFSRYAITEDRAKQIETYISEYKIDQQLDKDVLTTPRALDNAALDTAAKKIREIVLYQNQVYPNQHY